MENRECLEAVKIPEARMQQVYQEMRTPYKMGMVLCGEGSNIDCPNVFRRPDGYWGMIFAKHVPGEAMEGYETWMAVSSDLIRWEIEGRLLSKKKSGWDCCQADGGLCLIETAWGGGSEVKRHQGKYWMTYIDGALPGYEPDPLQIGLACSNTMEPGSWERMEAPILSTQDEDARSFEKATLYKSTVIYDKERSLGAPYVMFYNAKQEGLWVERIGMAVSADMLHWKRYADGPVVQNAARDIANIAGDPQLIRYEDLWVMHYFVAEGEGSQ